jgi:hypothetical protein
MGWERANVFALSVRRALDIVDTRDDEFEPAKSKLFPDVCKKEK